MDQKTMAVFAGSLGRIVKAINVSSEEIEAFIDDPVIEDYYNNLQEVSNDLNGVIYAIEQSLDALTDEGYN